MGWPAVSRRRRPVVEQDDATLARLRDDSPATWATDAVLADLVEKLRAGRRDGVAAVVLDLDEPRPLNRLEAVEVARELVPAVVEYERRRAIVDYCAQRGRNARREYHVDPAAIGVEFNFTEWV